LEKLRVEMMRNAHILVGKPEGKSPLGKPRHKWEGNIKINLWEIERLWIGLIWLRIETRGGLL
jgi:hypothetical protein